MHRATPSDCLMKEAQYGRISARKNRVDDRRRVERFLQMLVHDTLGEIRVSAKNETHLREFNVAVG